MQHADKIPTRFLPYKYVSIITARCDVLSSLSNEAGLFDVRVCIAVTTESCSVVEGVSLSFFLPLRLGLFAARSITILALYINGVQRILLYRSYCQHSIIMIILYAFTALLPNHTNVYIECKTLHTQCNISTWHSHTQITYL